MAKMQAWKGEVVSKLTGGVKTLLKANGCDYRTGDARIVVAPTPSRSWQGNGTHDDQGRRHRHRHRLAADRDPGVQVRRQADRRLDRARCDFATCPSGFSSSAAATSASSSARSTPSSARKVTVVEALPTHPAGQRPGDRRAWWRASSRSWASRCITGAKAQVVGRRRTARAVVDVEVKDGKNDTIEADKVLSPSAAARTRRTSASRSSA